jgi:hypothetical protein
VCKTIIKTQAPNHIIEAIMKELWAEIPRNTPSGGSRILPDERKEPSFVSLRDSPISFLISFRGKDQLRPQTCLGETHLWFLLAWQHSSVFVLVHLSFCSPE